LHCCLYIMRRPRISPPFPYTTLFRSLSREKTAVNWEAIPGTELFQSTASAISASTTPANIVYYGSNTGELFRIDNTLDPTPQVRSEEHTSELQSRENLVCRLLLEKKK